MAWLSCQDAGDCKSSLQSLPSIIPQTPQASTGRRRRRSVSSLVPLLSFCWLDSTRQQEEEEDDLSRDAGEERKRERKKNVARPLPRVVPCSRHLDKKTKERWGERAIDTDPWRRRRRGRRRSRIVQVSCHPCLSSSCSPFLLLLPLSLSLLQSLLVRENFVSGKAPSLLRSLPRLGP